MSLERARQATAIERRTELYGDFTLIFIEAAPSVPIYHESWSYVQQGDLKGFAGTLLFSPSSRFYNVHEWYLRTRTVE